MIPVFPPKYEEIWQTYLSSQPVNGKSQLYTPQKSNIDTKHGHISKESTFSKP